MSGAAAALVVVLSALAFPRATAAQTADAVACETEANRRKAAWATAKHSGLANDWESETRQIQLYLCRMGASSGDERLRHAEDLGRVIFTGEGVHPVVGTIAPGNGLAAGAVLNHEWAAVKRPLRFSANAEGRVSINTSWLAGAVLNVVGSSASRTNQHIHAVFEARHAQINQVGFFGLGSLSARDETRFALAATTARVVVERPATHGFSALVQLEGLHAAPGPFTGSGAPSIEQRFSDETAPGLAQATTYVVPGVGISWHYPEDETLTGYSTGLTATVRRYQEATGAAYSFTRTDVVWTHQLTPDTAADLGTLSASLRLSASAAQHGDRVPFYLQPTLGGSDINSGAGLRGYRDYRFRAPDTLLAQFEYAHGIRNAPLGLFAFADVGTVGRQLSDLDHDVKHSFGAGLTFSLGGVVFGRLYYAWSPEGSRLVFGGNTNAVGSDPRMRGVF
jgi:hypothetical protein